MSIVRDNFAKAVQAHDWNGAFTSLNGLNMYEMLNALASLQSSVLNDLLKESSNFWYPVNMPRIAFAATVVKQNRIPDQIPGDLTETGQVQDAKKFLMKNNGRSERTASAPAVTNSGKTFSTADQAALAAIDEINPTSIANNWEYAGRIFQMHEGQFIFTRPKTLMLDAVSDPGPNIPGYVKTGTYHTHAGGFHDTDEVFSPG